MMKIAITGGHFAPAYALITALNNKAEFIIIGRKHPFEGDLAESYEYIVAQREGIPFFDLKTARLQRKITNKTLPSLLKFPNGIHSAYKILKQESPDLIISFGGYLSLPVSIAAKMLNIPVVIHEQTQHAGLANKVVAKVATKVLISFESSRRFFPKGKTVLVGNPIRTEIFDDGNALDVPTDLPIIYITGGSAGAHPLNILFEKAAPELLKHYTLIHQTGDAKQFQDFDKLITIRDRLPKTQQSHYYITKYVLPEQIGWVYKNTTLVVGRAGVNTVCELLALEKMSLLVPLPHGQHNEQRSNAQLVKKVGLGEYVEQDDLNPQLLIEKIHQMIEHKRQYKLSDEKGVYAMRDAIQNIINELQFLYEEKKKKSVSTTRSVS